MSVNQTEASTAVRFDLAAIFVSLELSRSKWLLTSISLRIPTKPPPRSEKIAPPYSEMMSPPRERGLSGIDRFGFVLGRRQAVGFVFRRRILSPSRFSRWALWTRRSRMASA